MFEPQHNGLYFGTTEIETARTHAKREPFKTALATLATLQPADNIGAAIAAGFRYRFTGDDAAAARARDLLINHSVGLNLPADGSLSYLDACAVTMAVGQAFELVRDMLPDDAKRGWLALYNEQLETLRAVDSDLSLLEEIWRTAMKLAGGVVLERSDVFVLGVEDFRHIVRTHIHPEGYLPLIVENQPGNALEMQVFAAKGLVLGAEAATHAGSDLWSYESRGISAKTAAIYAAAYYEYPDTWKWDEPPTPEVTEALYQQNAGFFEMLNRKLDPVVLDATMDKLRPVFDPYGGGLTTLSHGVPKRRGLFGFLGG